MLRMNTERTENDATREPCPPGELRTIADRTKPRRRRDALRQIGGVTAALIAAGAGGYLVSEWLWGVREYDYGGIVCSQVVPLFRDYHAKSLDVETSRKIAVHLEQCSQCGPAYQRLVEKMDSVVRLPRRSESRGSRLV
jgi:hypothetical protein